MTTEILTTFAASRTIIKQSRLCKVETGGILVGTLEPLTIVAAGSPGPNATHRPAQFTSDPAADQACLAEARRRHGEQITVTGWWHKHPAALTTPSGGDCHQVQQLMSEYADGQPVLIGIVNHEPRLTRNRTTLHLYSVYPAAEYMEHAWRLVGSEDRRLLDALQKAPRRPNLKQTDYWRDEDFQSYLNPIGRDRINQEVQRLREAGWKVEMGRRTSDQLLVLNLRNSSTPLR
jgi:proteasome lid subunit RPN8/RPN11